MPQVLIFGDLRHKFELDKCMVASRASTSLQAMPLRNHGTHLTTEILGIDSTHRRVKSNRGVAAVELAVTLPLLVILVFGAMEMGNAAFLRQSLNIAAYEAAKVITQPGDNEALARTRCQEILTVRRITVFTIAFSPTLTAATARGTQVTVTLSAPASNLSYGPVKFMSGKTTTSSVVMVRM